MGVKSLNSFKSFKSFKSFRAMAKVTFTNPGTRYFELKS
jgi:hypothetical protein